MFYLASFLALLIGLLILMQDPLSTTTRMELDTNQAEFYVVSFVNQHQAVKDYMKMWLGRVYPGNNTTKGGGAYSVDTALDTGDVVQRPYVHNAVAVSIPFFAESFLPMMGSIARPVIVSEWSMGTNGHQGSKFSPTAGWDSLDSDPKNVNYHSAFVCLNNLGLVTQCYEGYCEDPPGTFGWVSANDCGGERNLRTLKLRDGVKPYVITYAKNKPGWWGEINGAKKPLRQQLWRRAIAKRTHSSESCGMLVSSADGYRWLYNKSKRGDGRVTEQEESSFEFGRENYGKPNSKWCIDNGYRCMQIVPGGISDFLSFPADIGDNLSDVFLCMSPVSDPYARIVPPTYHFDGVDFWGMGAPVKPLSTNSATDGTKKWWSVGERPGFAHWTNDANIEGFDWGSGSEYYAKFMKLTNSDQKLVMPFNHVNTDFTMNVVLYIDVEEPQSNDLLIGPNTGNFYAQFNSAHELEMNVRIAGIPGSYQNIALGPPSSWKGAHALTFVNRASDRKFDIYLDGRKMVTVDDVDFVNGEPVEFGGDQPDIYLGDVRWYDGQALRGSGSGYKGKIGRNLDVDSWRYDIMTLRDI